LNQFSGNREKRLTRLVVWGGDHEYDEGVQLGKPIINHVDRHFYPLSAGGRGFALRRQRSGAVSPPGGDYSGLTNWTDEHPVHY